MSDPQSVSKPIASRHALRNVRAFRRTLLNWFARYGADYPWRKTRDPYAILVSEIMLQQTTIGSVIQNRRFERFLDTFPDLHSLAEAPERDLLRAWEGLGYYNRMRRVSLLSTRGYSLPPRRGWSPCPGLAVTRPALSRASRLIILPQSLMRTSPGS